jgi:23S rRNA pseudouridine2605 synthase
MGQEKFAKLPRAGNVQPTPERFPPFRRIRVTLLFNTVKTAKRSPPILPNAKHVGLARALSKLGLCSRSQAFELIREGKVRLNGTVVKNPESPVRLGRDRIEMMGKPVTAARKVYFVLNKPRGIVTTAADEKGRDTIYSLLPSPLPWIAPAGRLDKASEGLLLLTNDSEWAARITDPASHLDKTYHIQIAAVADLGLLEALQHGVRDSTGETLKAKHASILRTGEKNSWLEITLDEGKNRQIRRMLVALEVEVLRLIRVSIGPLQLGDLAKGALRPLQRQEKLALDCALHNTSLATREIRE